MVHFSGPRRW